MRKVTRYNYTAWDIAQRTGKSINQVRDDIGVGKLDMRDLESMATYIEEHRSSK